MSEKTLWPSFRRNNEKLVEKPLQFASIIYSQFSKKVDFSPKSLSASNLSVDFEKFDGFFCEKQKNLRPFLILMRGTFFNSQKLINPNMKLFQEKTPTTRLINTSAPTGWRRHLERDRPVRTFLSTSFKRVLTQKNNTFRHCSWNSLRSNLFSPSHRMNMKQKHTISNANFFNYVLVQNNLALIDHLLSEPDLLQW